MRISPYLSIIRPANYIFVVLCVVAGGYLAVPGVVSWGVLLAAGLSAALISAFGYVINDYYDFDIDVINRPDRPLPSGKISRQSAFLYGVLLGLAGVLISVFIGKAAFLIALFCALNLYFYAFFFKRTPLFGNVLVGVNSALTFLYGAVSINAAINYKSGVFGLAVIALVLTIVREIMKTIEDYKGDKKYNIMTISVKYGMKKAAITAIVFTVLCGAALFWQMYVAGSFAFAVLLLVVVVPLIVQQIGLLRQKDYINRAAKMQRLIKIQMLFVLIVYLALHTMKY